MDQKQLVLSLSPLRTDHEVQNFLIQAANNKNAGCLEVYLCYCGDGKPESYQVTVEDTEQFKTMIKPLTALNELILTVYFFPYNWFNYLPILRELFDQQPIRTLKISGYVPQTFPDLIHLLAMFPKLESLHLDTVGEWKGFKPEQLADLPKPPHLEVLRLEGCNQHVFDGILSWLNQLPELRLREIAFNETIKENTFNLTLYDFLQRTAPTLEQVRMDLVKYHTFERVSPFTKPFLINIPNLHTIVFSNIPLEPILLKFTEHHPETPFAWVIKTLKELDPTNLREIKFQITIWDFENLQLFPFARLKAALEAKAFPQLQHLTFVVSTKFMNGVASQVVSMITNFIKNESGLPEDKLRFEFTPDDLFGRWRNEQGVSLGPPMLLGHPNADESQGYQSDHCFRTY